MGALVKVAEWDAPTGARVVEGAEVSIIGERGRFRFHHHVVNLDTGAEWVDVFGPVGGQHGQHRSFDTARVRRVHRTRTEART